MPLSQMNSKEGSRKPMAEPPVEIPDPEVPGTPAPDSLATKEVTAFGRRGEWFLRSSQYEWWLNIILKALLFIVVIILNIWWTHRVLQLVWESADVKSDYHLAN